MEIECVRARLGVKGRTAACLQLGRADSRKGRGLVPVIQRIPATLQGRHRPRRFLEPALPISVIRTIPGLLPGRRSCKLTRLMNLLRLTTFDLNGAADFGGAHRWGSFLLAGLACLSGGATGMAAEWSQY